MLQLSRSAIIRVRMFLCIFLSLSFLIIIPRTVAADNGSKFQSKQIKNNPAMIWAEREAADIATARQLAETDLLQKMSNNFGLFDMHGNAGELCTMSDGRYVIRGGSQKDVAENCRSGSRKILNKTDNTQSFGFRLVVDGD